MDAERIARLKDWLKTPWSVEGNTPNDEYLRRIAAYIDELEQQLTYQTDRAESFCTRLHEEEHRNEELRQRCETMSAYLRTHDHTKHDAAMAAAREHNQGKEGE